MRRAARVDANQGAIVSALEDVGASVFDASQLGGGFSDLVVGFRRVNYLLEVKDGAKVRSARTLTDAQKDFHATWRGRVIVVESVEEALAAIGATGPITAQRQIRTN